jgi:CheY-like chemotaxis protein
MTQPSSRRPLVLVIDETAINIGMVRYMLEPSGYSVVWTHDGELAREVARAVSPDLILCDIRMRNHDKRSTLAVIREDAELSKIPIAFLSPAVWPDAESKDGVRLGAAKFINRPIDASTLLAEIRSCLE